MSRSSSPSLIPASVRGSSVRGLPDGHRRRSVILCRTADTVPHMPVAKPHHNAPQVAPDPARGTLLCFTGQSLPVVGKQWLPKNIIGYILDTSLTAQYVPSHCDQQPSHYRTNNASNPKLTRHAMRKTLRIVHLEDNPTDADRVKAELTRAGVKTLAMPCGWDWFRSRSRSARAGSQERDPRALHQRHPADLVEPTGGTGTHRRSSSQPKNPAGQRR